MKKTTKKITSLILAAALTASVFAGCGSTENTSGSSEQSSESAELQTLRVAVMTGQPDQYTAYIGSEEGIFEKYGL